MEVTNPKKSHRFTMDDRLEAVRSFLFKERTRISICKSLGITEKSFDGWRHLRKAGYLTLSDYYR